MTGYHIKNTGILNASGKDLTDFLNRMSANDLRKFGKNEYIKTVLTSDKGRIIDLICFVSLNENYFILTSSADSEKVKSHLEKYIITDDVSLYPVLNQYSLISVFCDNPSELAEKLFNKKLSVNEVLMINKTDFAFTEHYRADMLNIVCPIENTGSYENKLSGYNKLTEEDFDNFRIENGIAGVNELSEEINPVECGLKEFISFNKGCYIGQEVIARLDSQGKIPKQMIKIYSGNELRAGDKILFDGKETGFISSTVKYENKYKALGFIRSTELDYQKSYSVRHNNSEFNISIYKIN